MKGTSPSSIIRFVSRFLFLKNLIDALFQLQKDPPFDSDTARKEGKKCKNLAALIIIWLP